MKRIELRSLHLKNFKGIRDLKINCEKETNIYGGNATGKTTFKDALKWLLFGKDSGDRTDTGKGAFTLKTLDETGRAIPGLEHTVTGVFYIEETKKTLSRSLREKWTKKRGKPKPVFSGHETKFWVDGVPVNAGEYQKEVSGIIEETLFKLITDPLYFSSYMHWQERRSILYAMIDEVTVDEVIGKDKKLKELKALLGEDSDVDKLRKKIAAEKKMLNDELKDVPVRIDECSNSLVEAGGEAQLKGKLEELTGELNEAEELFDDTTKENTFLTEKKAELSALQRRISEIEMEVQRERFSEGYDLEGKLQQFEKEKDSKEESLEFAGQQAASLAVQIEELKSDIHKYRKQWDDEKAKEFELNDEFVCPTCKRELPDDAVEEKKKELMENFNSEKARQLNSISTLGKETAMRKERAECRLIELEEEQSKLNREIAELAQAIKNTEKGIEDFENSDTEYPDEYYKLRTRAILLAEAVKAPEDKKAEADELRDRKKELGHRIDAVKSELRNVESNKKMRARVAELEARERELSQQIAELERREFLCESFVRARVQLMDSRINSMFKMVRFKLFDEQINGGLTETCEAMIDGVPFSDANNAAKINAGIDIINTLSEYYDVSAPIVIDNRESINEVIDTDAQVINLIVSKDKKLKVA